MAALVEEEEKSKALKGKKQAKKKAAKAKSLVPSVPLPAPQAAGDVHSNGDTADATPSSSQQGGATAPLHSSSLECMTYVSFSACSMRFDEL